MIIYKITNKINNKKYIGQTTQALKSGWNNHCTQKKNSAISVAIQLYGKENFEIKVLCHCSSIEEMNHREKYYIVLFNTMAPIGYNLMTGGSHGFHSEETKLKIKQANSGENNYAFGKKRPLEHRKNISEGHKSIKKQKKLVKKYLMLLKVNLKVKNRL